MKVVKAKDDESEDESGEPLTEAELSSKEGEYLVLNWSHFSCGQIKADGRVAIEAFVLDGTPVDRKIKGLARRIQDFLPESATTNEAVALHFLTTSTSGVRCLYHMVSDKDYKARNKPLPVMGFYLTGVTGTVRKAKDKGSPTTGHLRCGCSIDAALSYFLWWKTWTIRGPDTTNEDSGRSSFLVEPMSSVQFNPRARNLVMQKLEQLTGVTADNMYPPPGIHYDSLEHQRYLLQLQFRHVLERLRKVNLGIGSDAFTQEEAAIFADVTKGIFNAPDSDSDEDDSPMDEEEQ